MNNDDRQVNAWDVVQDLHFLFATDDQLHDELTYVCGLISSSENLENAAENQRNNPVSLNANLSAQKRIRNEQVKPLSGGTRQQREIKRLKEQVEILKEQLLEAKRQAASTNADMSIWERAAREQLYAKSKAMQENDGLRTAVNEQASFIDDMTRVLRKKPRLSLDVHSEAWRTYKLAAQASLRAVAIHAIADRQYSQQQTAFIQAGLFGCETDFLRAGPIPLPNGTVLVERVYHVTLAAPFRLVGTAVWSVFNGTHYMPLPEGAEETLEALDQHTVYRSFSSERERSSAFSNMVYKYYVEGDRELVVWRSVLEDALVPHMANGIVHDEWGWLEIVPIDQTTCRLSLLLQLVSEPVTEERASTVEELVDASVHIVEKYSFAHPPDTPGTFPGGPIKEEANSVYLPHPKRTFVERNKQLELTLKRAINDVVLEFQTTQNKLNH